MSPDTWKTKNQFFGVKTTLHTPSTINEKNISAPKDSSGSLNHTGNKSSDVVVKEESVNPSEICHIGDNFNSDYKIALKYGATHIRLGRIFLR